jgi:hypothetical protein
MTFNIMTFDIKTFGIMTFSIMTQQSAYSFQQLGRSLPSVASMSTSMFEIFESKQNFQFLNFSCWFLRV